MWANRVAALASDNGSFVPVWQNLKHLVQVRTSLLG